jgi:hypothetical protein
MWLFSYRTPLGKTRTISRLRKSMHECIGSASTVADVTLPHLLSACFSCWADVVAEDIYITIYRTDGYDAALSLRNQVVDATSGTRSNVSVSIV